MKTHDDERTSRYGLNGEQASIESSRLAILSPPYVTVILVVGIVLSGAMLVAGISRQHFPDNHQGYAPAQPLAYSHRLHADALQIDCQYCHAGASTSRYAGIPSNDVCMRCHKVVTASFDATQAANKAAEEQGASPSIVISEALRPLYESMGLDANLQPIPGKEPTSIAWVRVHRLPDYVYFDHRAHVNAGVSCQYCHGPVETMQTVSQHSSLSMGWCVNCHRDAKAHGVNGLPANPSTDCATCHY